MQHDDKPSDHDFYTSPPGTATNTGSVQRRLSALSIRKNPDFLTGENVSNIPPTRDFFSNITTTDSGRLSPRIEFFSNPLVVNKTPSPVRTPDLSPSGSPDRSPKSSPRRKNR